MGGWRRQKGYDYNQEFTRTRSNNKKPPLGNWQPTVPAWEKRFCKLVGLVTWEKIVESKKFMHLFESVVKWNDSAGEEAFHNAKNQFYARVHDLPCDISLPNPDLYIDEIDWDSKIDPELLLDLEREPVVPDADKKDENVIIFGNALLSNQGFSTSGWGESEEDLKRNIYPSFDNNDNPWEGNCNQNNITVKENGWGDCGNNLWSWNDTNIAMGGSGWGDGWNNSLGGNQCVNNNYESDVMKDTTSGGVWGAWDVVNNDGTRVDTGTSMSRYKTSRFHGKDYPRNNAWRSGNGRKRGNWEHRTTDNRPDSRQWDPIN